MLPRAQSHDAMTLLAIKSTHSRGIINTGHKVPNSGNKGTKLTPVNTYIVPPIRKSAPDGSEGLFTRSDRLTSGEKIHNAHCIGESVGLRNCLGILKKRILASARNRIIPAQLFSP